MYKPYTIDHYKVYQFIKQHFVIEHFLISPLSRSALLLQDQRGDKIAFSCQNNVIQEIEIPIASEPETVGLFIKEFTSDPSIKTLNTFDAITQWWLNVPNPLSYQQALNLPDDLYHHFLTYPLLTDEEVRHLLFNSPISEKQYNDIRLWYRNGNYASCWLGLLGVDGTGIRYGLTFRFRKPEAQTLEFYLMD